LDADPLISLKSILVHLDDGESCDDRLRLSAELAAASDAHLSALYVGRFLTQSLLVDAPPSGTLLRALEEEQRSRTDRARELFDSRTKFLSRGREFHHEEGDPVRWLTVYGRYADIIAVRQPGEEDAIFGVGGIPGALALSCGRPLLVVPCDGVKSLVPGRVMIAWNGSREATRAVADALPFLHMASKVEVVSVTDDETAANNGPSARDLCRHLSLHGIEAEHITLPTPEIEIPEALLSRAAAQSAELIVFGAYGHSRFRELVLGGVTRHLLGHSAVPLLVSH
jgi:nucleotide-binding universal stress UspA family protein